ncbi:MAG: transketolase [Bacilli bacterium]|nr:transketolase [Bacilli bacterium]
MKSVEFANKIRIDVVEMAHISHGSHVGSALSIIDIVAVLYNDIMKYDINDCKKNDRDRLILSKGHAGSSIYAALAEKGFFPVEELKTHYANGSKLSGHVSHKGVPGVEFSTGSLGHGIGVGSGMALSLKRNEKDNRVFVIMGDGECNEGSVWESALFARQFNLSNLTVIIDHNNLQGLGDCNKILKMDSLFDKWIAFDWNVIEIDGHIHNELKKALASINDCKPTCIIANTIKGKGVSFMENNNTWHYRDPQGEDYEKAVKELEAFK